MCRGSRPPICRKPSDFSILVACTVPHAAHHWHACRTISSNTNACRQTCIRVQLWIASMHRCKTSQAHPSIPIDPWQYQYAVRFLCECCAFEPVGLVAIKESCTWSETGRWIAATWTLCCGRLLEWVLADWWKDSRRTSLLSML